MYNDLDVLKNLYEPLEIENEIKKNNKRLLKFYYKFRFISFQIHILKKQKWWKYVTLFFNTQLNKIMYIYHLILIIFLFLLL